jgi:tetratricopeptide (TPR) repeat protein
MTKHAKRWGAALVAAVLAVGLVGTAWAQDTQDDALLAVFQQGITYYETGEYEQARGAFDQVLAAQPTLAMAVKMREVAELGVFFKMMENDMLGPQAEKLLDLMVRAVRQNLRIMEAPEQFVEDLRATEGERYGTAYVTLRSHGPYSVPYLLPLLGEAGTGELALVGRVISLLGGMQKDACLPLIQVLRHTDDALVKGRLAGALAQLADIRAVPALMAMWEDPGELEPVRREVGRAIRAITDAEPETLSSAVDQYISVGQSYLAEDSSRVGYTYGFTGDVWYWVPADTDDAATVLYEEVPDFLYHKDMAENLALEGLEIEPASTELQALLGAALVRQLAVCEQVRLAESPAEEAGEVAAAQHEAAVERADMLADQIPMALRLMSTSTLARALDMALDVEDGAASLYLVKTLADRLAARPMAAEPEAMDTLARAIDSRGRHVRYNAAVTLVASCPDGACGDPEKTMAALSATLRAATARTALVVIGDFQTRNTLGELLRDCALQAVEAPVNEGGIQAALSLQPSVDVVFLSANVPDLLFGRVLEMVQEDPRTRGVPVYAVIGPGDEVADVVHREGIAAVLPVDDLRPVKIQPIADAVLARSLSAFTDEEEALVLKAVQAVQAVDPEATAYDLPMLEPALVMALTGYGEDVTRGAIGALVPFGSPEVLPHLGKIVAGDASTEVKVAACKAIVAVVTRTQAAVPPDTVAAVKNALVAEDAALQQAGAEALSVAGLEAGELVGLIRTAALDLE